MFCRWQIRQHSQSGDVLTEIKFLNFQYTKKLFGKIIAVFLDLMWGLNAKKIPIHQFPQLHFEYCASGCLGIMICLGYACAVNLLSNYVRSVKQFFVLQNVHFESLKFGDLRKRLKVQLLLVEIFCRLKVSIFVQNFLNSANQLFGNKKILHSNEVSR